ncbi:glucan endo-1,3-beta-D-glucosidase-like [Actinidia eriantha]|uniref:glucan endo-1,3-beta-D-glucosidase-like n=1 Tax=Actinidia eriantha TaxID=165200 RepID=UPI00258C6874|nr:glucan endo-1,3-beta-D-glucosidase-like [Actinidia eriantha]
MGRINQFLCSLAFLLFLVVHSNADWCVARSSASNDQLQAIISYCCGQVNCNAILPGGSCYFPNTLPNHASWALDQYYKAKGVCLKLGDVSTIAITNPSFGACQYPPK